MHPPAPNSTSFCNEFTTNNTDHLPTMSRYFKSPDTAFSIQRKSFRTNTININPHYSTPVTASTPKTIDSIDWTVLRRRGRIVIGRMTGHRFTWNGTVWLVVRALIDRWWRLLLEPCCYLASSNKAYWLHYLETCIDQRQVHWHSFVLNCRWRCSIW